MIAIAHRHNFGTVWCLLTFGANGTSTEHAARPVRWIRRSCREQACIRLNFLHVNIALFASRIQGVSHHR
ncbi:hypothetical protein PR002_g30618 [Phytophthora rubi]|uniref:Secreted protein n=1 Tax=Phytophthora rubi TaxID=129364 RepID=A0A6A3GNT0_9STRA|nr:hypothetical protein PR002_g30618 [Phytophthora rubi]